MATVFLNIEYFNNPADGKPLSFGNVYIGLPDLDPKIEANRINVTIQQEDGTDVVILPNAQPITLNAGGRFQYLGSPVSISVVQNYSMTVDDSLNAQVYHNPDAKLADQSQVVTRSDIYIQQDNPAAMDADASIVLGEYHRTSGYNTAGDGGGNDYLIVPAGTAPADGGAYFDLTASGLQAKAMFPGGFATVGQFGGTAGATDRTVEFQAAVDYTADTQIAVLHVGSGSYTGSFDTLNIGTRTMVWVEEGDVSYTNDPVGNRVNSSFNGDTSRPWYVGKNGFINDITDGLSTDRPTVRIQRSANHTGGDAFTTNAGALSVETIVNKTAGRVDNFENAIVAEMDSYRSDITTGSPNLSAVVGTSFKQNPSTGGTFGCNFVARDQTGRMSSASLGGIVGAELDVVASGPDDAQSRIVVEVIARGYDASTDGATTVHAGIRVRPSQGGVITPEPVKIEYGVKVEEGLLGSIGIGFAVNGGDTGILIDGAYTVAPIEVNTTGQAIVKIGSDVSANGTATADIALTGKNSVNADVTYARIRSVVVDNTSGTHGGRIDWSIFIAGVETTVMDLDSTSATDPFKVMTGGVLKQVSEGVTDSGGVGFRQLLVTNI